MDSKKAINATENNTFDSQLKPQNKCKRKVQKLRQSERLSSTQWLKRKRSMNSSCWLKKK